MKTRNLVAALALSLGVTGGAHAAVSFDPDGAGALPAMTIGAFDWGPTSIFAKGSVSAISNFVGSGGACPAGSCNFDLYTHARVIGFLTDGGASLPNPTGLNSTFELTMIARYTEVVTGATLTGGFPSSVSFATVPSAAGFLQVFYDNAPNSVDVSGSGFNNGDLILSGTSVGPGNSNFTVNVTASTVPLDGAGSNDYTGQLTATGFGGSANIPVDNLSQDPAFFLTQLDTFGIQFAQISLGLPYITVNPSDCFSGAPSGVAVAGAVIAPSGVGCTAAHVNGLMSANAGEPAPGIVPSIGPINSFSGGEGVTDFVAQTDFNSPLAGVPEPGSLALLGLALGALGLRRGGFRRS